MKIWLDDVRTPPDDSWTWAKSSAEAIALLRWAPERPTTISLDFDLGVAPGYGEDNGLRVAQYVVDMIDPPTDVRVHSMNPVGAKRLREILGI